MRKKEKNKKERNVIGTDIYVTPFSGRYASKEMNKVWSADSKYSTWRKLMGGTCRNRKELGIKYNRRTNK